MAWRVQDLVGSHHFTHVHESIDHGEAPEAMRSLAWIVHGHDVDLPTETIHEIVDLMGGSFEPSDLPPVFAECAELTKNDWIRLSPDEWIPPPHGE